MSVVMLRANNKRILMIILLASLVMPNHVHSLNRFGKACAHFANGLVAYNGYQYIRYLINENLDMVSEMNGPVMQKSIESQTMAYCTLLFVLFYANYSICRHI